MLAWLIEIGFDVNATNENDYTVLEYAIELNRADAVSMLLESGAIPFSIAQLENHWRLPSAEVLKLLLSAGADLNDTTHQTEYILDLNECCWYREESVTNIS